MSKLNTGPDEMVRMYEPSDIHIVVTGGETQSAFEMIGGSYRGKATVLVDDWR